MKSGALAVAGERELYGAGGNLVGASDGAGSPSIVGSLAVSASENVPELNWKPMARTVETPRDCPNATDRHPSCKRRGCPVCGVPWARNQARVLEENLEATPAIGLAGAVATIAITPPGKDLLPWDDDYCRSRGLFAPRHKHQGKYGCRVQQKALREWTATLTWNWKKFREAAMVATKRDPDLRKKLGYVPEIAIILTRVWEPQKRGAAHLHLVVPYGSTEEKLIAECFRRHLQERHERYGFGNVQKHLEGRSGHMAARYLANYLTGRSGKKGSIRENIADPRLPRSLIWVAPRLTRVTMVTMRSLRRARHLWAWSELRCSMPLWSSYVEAIRGVVAFRRVYPARAGPLGDEVDLVELIRFAKLVDGYEERSELRPGIFDPLGFRIEWSERITRWAFRATAAAPAAAA